MPSNPAMRAAERLVAIRYGDEIIQPKRRKWLSEHKAEIIDQETGLPALIEALHEIYALFGHLLTDNSPHDTNVEIIKERRERIGKLLLKTEGRGGT